MTLSKIDRFRFMLSVLFKMFCLMARASKSFYHFGSHALPGDTMEIKLNLITYDGDKNEQAPSSDSGC